MLDFRQPWWFSDDATPIWQSIVLYRFHFFLRSTSHWKHLGFLAKGRLRRRWQHQGPVQFRGFRHLPLLYWCHLTITWLAGPYLVNPMHLTSSKPDQTSRLWADTSRSSRTPRWVAHSSSREQTFLVASLGSLHHPNRCWRKLTWIYYHTAPVSNLWLCHQHHTQKTHHTTHQNVGPLALTQFSEPSILCKTARKMTGRCGMAVYPGRSKRRRRERTAPASRRDSRSHATMGPRQLEHSQKQHKKKLLGATKRTVSKKIVNLWLPLIICINVCRCLSMFIFRLVGHCRPL